MPKNLDYLHTENDFVSYIIALNKQEWKRFDAFVRSPYFNKKEQLVTLYQLINKRYPFKNGLFKTDLLPALGKQRKYPKQYTLSQKEDGLLRKLIMEFTSLLKEFIIQETEKEHTTIRQRNLIDFMMVRRQHKPIPKLLQQEIHRAQESDDRNLAYFQGQFLLAEADFYMTILSNDQTNTSKLEALNKTILNRFLNTLFLYYSAALNRESILQIQHSYPLLDPILQYIEANLDNLGQLTLCYYHTFLMNRDKAPKQFMALRNIMVQNPKFDDTTNRQIYAHMLNYCSKQIRLGELEFQHEKHQIYTTMLDNNWLSAGIYFSPQHYLLIAKNALKLGHLDWTWTFLNKYKLELNPKHQSQYLLVLAQFHFYNKAYPEALSCLLQINYSKDFFSILNYRILWIQIHYEETDPNLVLDEHPVYHALEALRQFLAKESKMSERINDSYQNFMRLTKRLFHFKQQPTSLKRSSILDRLIQDTQQATYLDERDWLLTKADELKLDL